jgi:Uma2 family endonuclease
VTTVQFLSDAAFKAFIRQRRADGHDRKDEVWDGVYVIMPEPTNAHQHLVTRLTVIFDQVAPVGSTVLAGANVSDRRSGWKKNYRAPDVVVVLPKTRAIDCNTHWMGGPDFLVEVRSPGDRTEAKIPFYATVGVRELLIVHRDTRRLRLLRHDGTDLVAVEPGDFRGKKWLLSEVLPLAFRRTTAGGRRPRTEVRRTDATPASWVV